MAKTKSALAALLLLMLPSFFSGSPAPTPVATEKIDAGVAVQTTEQIVNSLASVIGRSKRPLPAWALDAANKAVVHWKLHRLSQRTAEIEKEVVEVLRIVAGLKDEAEAGRVLSEREIELTRRLLDAHGRRLDDLASRVDAIERGTRESDARIAKLEADNKALTAQNKALRASNDEVTRRVLADRCGAGRKRGPHGCVDNPQR